MKIITTIDFINSKNGGAQRVFNLIEHFKVEEVHVCCFLRRPNKVKENLRVIYHHITLKDLISACLNVLIKKKSISNSIYIRRSLHKLINSNEELIFHLSRSIQKPFDRSIKNSWVLDFCESHGNNLFLRSNSYPFILRKLILLESNRLLKLEKELINTFSRILFITQNDIQFKNATNKTILPNKIHVKCRHVEFEKKKKNQICFLGDMNYGPNINALKFIDQFVTNRDYVVKVFGKLPKHKIDLKNTTKIYFEGYIDNLEEVIPECYFTIFFSKDSTGLQNKFLDYLNFGIPIITNKEVADSFINGNPFLLISAEEDIENIVRENFGDRTSYEKIVTKGFEYLKNNYGK